MPAREKTTAERARDARDARARQVCCHSVRGALPSIVLLAIHGFVWMKMQDGLLKLGILLNTAFFFSVILVARFGGAPFRRYQQRCAKRKREAERKAVHEETVNVKRLEREAAIKVEKEKRVAAKKKRAAAALAKAQVSERKRKKQCIDGAVAAARTSEKAAAAFATAARKSVSTARSKMRKMAKKRLAAAGAACTVARAASGHAIAVRDAAKQFALDAVEANKMIAARAEADARAAAEAEAVSEHQRLAEEEELLLLFMPEAEGEEETATAPPPAPADALLHTTIPHAEIVGERTAATRIGVGRFGEVFRARRRRVGPVAVKVVPPLMDYRVEFETHLRLSMTMEGVCRMHGLCEDHSVFGTCFVMKLYERSLDDEIDADGAMELSRAVDVAATIAATMAELHDLRQILVADLKPANVLIDERGRPVISDFGVSQQIGTAMLSHGISSARGGTVHYMSPEQLGAEDEDGNDIRVTLQSDVWSFGCTLLHMLTGMMPWTDSTTGASLSEKKVMNKVAMRMRAPPLTSLPVATPDALRALLSECLQPLAGDRPRFGGDAGIAARLREIAADESECVVCMDKKRTHIFLPCGHRCVCAGCSFLVMRAAQPLCPYCRAPASSSVQTFG